MEIKVNEYAVEYTICYLFGARRLEKKEVPCNKAGYVKDDDLHRATIGDCEVVTRSLPFLKKTSVFLFVTDNVVCIEDTTNEEGENIRIIHTVAGSWLFFGFDGYYADRVGFAK